MSHPPVATRQFADHVDQLKCNDGVRFSHEYESIEPGQQFTWDASSLDVNKNKNRYANVIAYDHSRVVLQSLDGVVGSDYINANFMDGYRQQNAYIATQVPLLSLPPPLSLSLSPLSATWTRASLFPRFTETYTEPVRFKCGSLGHKISVDIQIFFAVYSVA